MKLMFVLAAMILMVCLIAVMAAQSSMGEQQAVAHALNLIVIILLYAIYRGIKGFIKAILRVQ